ncbi:hypothetical protein QBC37DRAFT_433086 [Rhypophila decipiens]|uniref:Clr5 domain-containing protein n=1 Tax=Rhypophila decipiens TaxID=261697 RepID=A0AAN6XXT1_9PEZI|nr:hypothetical protein QBC37DRAFT_433086 [Rhypophila decipiens]
MSAGRNGTEYHHIDYGDGSRQGNDWHLGSDMSQPQMADIAGILAAMGDQTWTEPLPLDLGFAPQGGMLPPPRLPADPSTYAPQTSVPAAHETDGGSKEATEAASVPPVGRAGAFSKRKQRARPPPDHVWEKWKDVIEGLYLKQNLSLGDTIEQMEKGFEFKASEKMYKDRFKQWRWAKNLPRGKGSWMVNRANQRKPKKTEFRWGNQMWTADRVLKTHGQVVIDPAFSTADHPTPSDIDYATPRTVAASPEILDHTQTENRSTDRKEPAPKVCSLDDGPVNLDLGESTLEELRNLDRAASSNGHREDAESMLRDVVSGFSRFLSPTHDDALRAAYRLACFYAHQARPREADDVLNWMTAKHRKRHGMNHEKTGRHLIRVVELLQKWSRHEHASMLCFRILDAAEDFEKMLTIDVVPHRGRRTATYTEREAQELADRISRLSDNSDGIDAYIKRLSQLINGGKGVLPIPKSLLTRLIHHCESFPETLWAQGIASRCLLAEHEIQQDDLEGARQTLTGTCSDFIRRLNDHGDLPETVGSLGRRLAFVHLDAKDEAACNRLLEEIATVYESKTSLYAGENDDNCVAIQFLVTIAAELNRRLSWDRCKPWVGRALSLSILADGPEKQESKRLQRMLETGVFESTTFEGVEDFMKYSGKLFKISIA